MTKVERESYGRAIDMREKTAMALQFEIGRYTSAKKVELENAAIHLKIAFECMRKAISE